MTFKSLFLLAFAFLQQVAAMAQNTDYLITRNHDTLYGNVMEYGILSADWDLTVGKGENLKGFKYRDVLEWKNGKMIWMIHHYKTKKGKDSYNNLFVNIYGKMRLLSDLLAERMKSRVYLEGRFIFITAENLERIIWPTMLKNQAFAKRYGNVPLEEVRKWTRGFQIRQLESAIIYYNRH